jgi:hypothetical protein
VGYRASLPRPIGRHTAMGRSPRIEKVACLGRTRAKVARCGDEEVSRDEDPREHHIEPNGSIGCRAQSESPGSALPRRVLTATSTALYRRRVADRSRCGQNIGEKLLLNHLVDLVANPKLQIE